MAEVSQSDSAFAFWRNHARPPRLEIAGSLRSWTPQLMWRWSAVPWHLVWCFSESGGPWWSLLSGDFAGLVVFDSLKYLQREIYFTTFIFIWILKKTFNKVLSWTKQVKLSFIEIVFWIAESAALILRILMHTSNHYNWAEMRGFL